MSEKRKKTSVMEEKHLDNDKFVSRKLMRMAYEDYMRHKTCKNSAYEFSLSSPFELMQLRERLNSGKYKIGRSTCFCVSRPRLREIYAAESCDRVVQHLLMVVFGDMFMRCFIPTTYNCIRGRGEAAMTRDIQNRLSENREDDMLMKLDIRGCFVNIDNKILWKQLRKLVIRECCAREELAPHIKKWLWLWEMVVMNRPEEGCKKHGDLSLFDLIPEEKRLSGKGLAIGNLTSQFCANLYLIAIDWALWKYGQQHGCYYGRYMDDMVLIGKRDDLLVMLRMAKRRLTALKLSLNERKFYFQSAYKSVNIIGKVHCRGRVYISNRTRENARQRIAEMDVCDVKRCVSSVNSYFGFMKGVQSYGIRFEMWKSVHKKLGGRVYCDRMRKIKRIRTRKRKGRRDEDFRDSEEALGGGKSSFFQMGYGSGVVIKQRRAFNSRSLDSWRSGNAFMVANGLSVSDRFRRGHGGRGKAD